MTRGTHAGTFRVRFVAALSVMYLGVVLTATLWPTTIDRGLSPYIDRLLAKLWSKGVPAFVDYAFIEFSANVVFFIPVGFLLAVLLPMRLWWGAIAGGALLSASVETAQGVFLPSRVSSIGDVVANSTGSVIGCLIAIALRLLILHRDTLVIRDVGEGRRASNGLPVRK